MPSSQKERRILRLECPEHGADAGLVRTGRDGETCGRTVAPSRTCNKGLVEVEYVPYDDDSDGAELSRMEDDMLEIHDALEDLGLKGAINAESIVDRIKSLEVEFIVCHAAGYPDPHSPHPNTLENAERFAREQSISGVTGKPVEPAPVIKRRIVTGWRVVDA